MSMKQNIVLLQNKESKTVFNRIMNFLLDKNSELTRTAYEEDIRDFFKSVIHKEVEELSVEDLSSFDEDDVVAYKNAMKIAYSAGTINRKLSAMRSLYRKLSASRELRESGVDSNVFNVENVKGEVNGYGSLTWEETKEMIERVKSYTHGDEKSLIIEFAAKTGFRIESILSITRDNFHYDDKNDIWIVKIIGKHHKEDKKPIKPEFHDRIMANYNIEKESVFSLTGKTMRLTIRKLCEEMNIDSKRNITFHSLKKMGVNYILGHTGDIKAAQRYANHSNAATTLNAYAEMNEDLSEMPSLRMGEETDISILKNLSKRELLKLISESNETVKQRLVTDAKKNFLQ